MSLMSVNRRILVNRITERMVTRDEGVTTADGTVTTTYLDIPGVLKDKETLHLASVVLYTHLVDFDATMFGGPTTGAIPLVLGMTMLSFTPNDRGWFIVRDAPKKHGLGRWFVGAEPGPGDKVVLTDDVASTGKSLVRACDRVQKTGATIMAVAPLVDRGDSTQRWFDPEAGWPTSGIPYLPVFTYTDLGLPPLGG